MPGEGAFLGRRPEGGIAGKPPGFRRRSRRGRCGRVAEDDADHDVDAPLPIAPHLLAGRLQQDPQGGPAGLYLAVVVQRLHCVDQERVYGAGIVNLLEGGAAARPGSAARRSRSLLMSGRSSVTTSRSVSGSKGNIALSRDAT